MSEAAASRTRHEPAATGAALSLVERLLQGEVRALARAISIVEDNRNGAAAILHAIRPHLGKAVVVGFTGPPGAGKSTLIDAFVGELCRRNRSVGILAVDPSSPLSGGAVLGDRVRMGVSVTNPHVYTRSVASRGHLGGLSRMAGRITDLMDAAGKDFVVLETVGTGQSEVEIADIADIKVVVSAPGLGDEIQAMKAGILEIADVLVVNKSDLPLAQMTLRHLQTMLALRQRAARDVPIVATAALKNEGIDALADAVDTLAAAGCRSHKRRDAWRAGIVHILKEAAGHRIDDMLAGAMEPPLAELCDDLAAGRIELADAVRRFLALAAS